MPFKTKKHKIAAGKHRVTVGENGKITWSPSAAGPGSGNNKRFSSELPNDTTDKLGVKKELLRIGVLAGIIIGLQLALRILNLPFVA